MAPINNNELPTAVAPNQAPCIIPWYLGGATFDTNEIPRGLINSSAMVSIRYVPISKNGVMRCASGKPPISVIAALDGNPMEKKVITKYPNAAIPIPMAIFFWVEGSFPLERKSPKKAIITGVRNTTKNGLMDWNISAP